MLINIPGYHFQLLDCSEDHGPASSITLTGLDYAPMVGIPTERGVTMPVFPFDFLTKSENTSKPDLRGHTFLDARRGILYEYMIDRESIWKLFDLQSADLHLQALHLAMIHMQDSELVAKVKIEFENF